MTRALWYAAMGCLACVLVVAVLVLERTAAA